MNKTNRTKPYALHQDFNFIMPIQFLLICRLLQVEPHKVLYQFMCNLGQENYANGPEQKITAKDYFLSCGYGQELFTDAEIDQIFEELNNISSLWPKNGPMKLIDLHGKWRKRYYRYWFKKWFWKFRRVQ